MSNCTKCGGAGLGEITHVCPDVSDATLMPGVELDIGAVDFRNPPVAYFVGVRKEQYDATVAEVERLTDAIEDALDILAETQVWAIDLTTASEKKVAQLVGDAISRLRGAAWGEAEMTDALQALDALCWDSLETSLADIVKFRDELDGQVDVNILIVHDVLVAQGEALAAAREVYDWIARMPDAGFNDRSPRWNWWTEGAEIRRRASEALASLSNSPTEDTTE